MRKFRVVLVGCGSMANTWTQYVLARADAEIVALVDIQQDNAQDMAKRYGLDCGVYSKLEEAILATKANLVLDITIPAAHRDIVIHSLEMGCDVFGEKPMASSMEEAQEMVQVAQRLGRSYAVMQNRRYLKDIRAFKHLISGGTIGQVGFVCADFFLGPHFGGFRELMDSPLILDMAIHTFDQARFITEADPISVYCYEFNPIGSWYKGNAAAICIFEMSDGSVFCYRGSWCAEGASTPWEAEWRVNGTKGTAIWNGREHPYAEVIGFGQEDDFMRKTKKIEAPFTWTGREGHYGCLDEMFTALLDGRKAETDCEDNIKSMTMVFGALESARVGKKILL